jgi:hypothetical protein
MAKIFTDGMRPEVRHSHSQVEKKREHHIKTSDKVSVAKVGRQ